MAPENVRPTNYFVSLHVCCNSTAPVSGEAETSCNPREPTARRQNTRPAWPTTVRLNLAGLLSWNRWLLKRDESWCPNLLDALEQMDLTTHQRL